MSNRTHPAWYLNLGEIGIPVLTWLIITFPIWFSPFHPAVVAYFIIAFDMYFFYKSLTTAYYATLSYKNILLHSKISFDKKLLEYQEHYNKKDVKSHGPDIKDIRHFIVIPNYKEPLHKLESTVKAITESDYPYKEVILVLAFEKREIEAVDKARTLKEKYGHYFRDILVAYHELMGKEIPGKASNQTYAARLVEKYITENNWKLERSIITICDADSMLSKNYLSYLTYEYLHDPDRDFHFYWAAVFLYNNFWQLPFFVRIQATLSSILRLAFLSQKDQLIHISTYSTNMGLLKKVDYWDVDIIPEDWHIYYQAFFTFGEKVKTLPLYTIINSDAVYSGNILKTFLNRYEQEKRWAWGVTDVAYAWTKLHNTPHIPLWSKLKRLFYLAENHLFWPTSFFILTVSASIPPLINPVFKRTVLGFLLPQLSGLILTLASVLLVLYIYLDIKLRERLKIDTKMLYLPLLFVQWFLLPIVSFFLSSLPALEAHTRLLLRKKITYKVTEKV